MSESSKTESLRDHPDTKVICQHQWMFPGDQPIYPHHEHPPLEPCPWCEIERLRHARDLSAQASATLRNESIAKNERIAKLEAAHQHIVDLYVANVGTMLSGEVCNEMAATSKRVLTSSATAAQT